MKSILALTAMMLLTIGANAAANRCAVLVEIYDETSRPAAIMIAKEISKKTNSNSYVLNVITAEIKQCQDKNVRERWTDFNPKFSDCTPKSYVYSKPIVKAAMATQADCITAASGVLVAAGFKSENITIRQSDKVKEYSMRITLPPRTAND